MKALLPVFLTIFLAELGDKTQLATVLFAAQARHSPWLLFATVSVALVAAAAIGVLVGGFAAEYINPRTLAILAGMGFIAIGAWTLIAALRA